MFTGLVQEIGTVLEIGHHTGGARVVIGTAGSQYGWGEAEAGGYRPRPGDSIAVNGCCLTLVESERTTGWRHGGGAAGHGLVMRFDAIVETMSKTTLGFLRVGDRVNLERSLAAGDLMGGHMVQGHVECVGEVVDVAAAARGGSDDRLTVRVPREVMGAIVPKGSVTVDGVSLTIAEVGRSQEKSQGVSALRADTDATAPAGTFTIALIPATLAKTTLGELRAGSKVNIETDVVARTVVWWMESRGS